MDNWQLIITMGMFLFAVLYIATLYHLAHGRERQAMEAGARVVLEALTRDGRIMAEVMPVGPAEPLNLGEEDFAQPLNEEPALPDVIVARNEQAARQMGDKIMDDLLKHTGLNK